MHPRSATGFMILPVLLGLVFLALGIPLAMGKVKPNSFYGFRVAKTLNSEAVWYKVNGFTGKAFLWCGTATMLLALAVLGLAGTISFGHATLQKLSLAIELVPLAVAVVASCVVCYRA